MKRHLDAMRHSHALAQRQRDARRWTADLLQGELTWAYVFMANRALWQAGQGDHPASVVYSFDPWFERSPDRLGPIGQRIYRFHDSGTPPPRRPWERHVSDQLVTGNDRPLHEELPPSLSGGRIVYHSVMVLRRALLPHGYLTGNVLPVLVTRDETRPRCLPVPHTLWPQELVQRWSQPS